MNPIFKPSFQFQISVKGMTGIKKVDKVEEATALYVFSCMKSVSTQYQGPITIQNQPNFTFYTSHC